MTTNFIQVGAMRVKLTPLGGTKYRLDYFGCTDPEDNTKLSADPVFFEEFDLEDKISWVSQLVVGNHAKVEGSGYLLDSNGKRHLRMRADPGEFDMTGKETVEEITRG